MRYQKLFSPLKVGDLTLPNRLVMAPLTRSRAQGPGDVPWELNVEYYKQRASAGLIISEATQISQQGKGYAFTPGIYTAEQLEGWRRVVDAVHAAGGRILAQLWHVGRISHCSLQPEGRPPVGPSSIRAQAATFIDAHSGRVPVSEPLALNEAGINAVLDDYAQAARNAKLAGFDGVELHAANGYLIDQFLRDGTNRRSDRYGGSLENRLRFPLAVVERLVEVLGKTRVGVRISPTGTFNDITDKDPHKTFVSFAKGLEELGIAFIEVVEHFSGQEDRALQARISQAIREVFSGAFIANGHYTPEQAEEAIAVGRPDAVSFGRLFIANPDLPRRLKAGVALTSPDPSTFYGGGAQGYTDYPLYDGLA